MLGKLDGWSRLVFDIEIKYIKGKEKKVVDALGIRVKVNHIKTMSSHGIDLHDQILQVG